VLFWKLGFAAGITGSLAYIHLRGRVRFRVLRQLTDHSSFLAPYNALVYLFSKVPATPYLDPALLPGLHVLRDNWQVIRDEALALGAEGHIRGAEKRNDLAFNSFFKKGWKRFYFKWYGAYLPSAAERCPKTIALLKQVPGLNAAMLTQLSPGSELRRHRDPFAGSLRYHLGLVTPGVPACRILVDGRPYYWKDGEDVLFDETYIHEAYNDTDQDRIILFCDMERPLHTPVMRLLNRIIGTLLGWATATENMAGDRVGILNRLYAGFYAFQQLGKRIKAFNRTFYYVLKYALMLGVLYLIFF